MTNFFVVEDDAKLKDLYCRILKKQGYSILETADDGEEAIKKYMQAEKKPDIIIIDHRK
ncbi:MAG: response regulator [Candidatus Hodarchaeales archaeon]|jgi:DNA-binding response OmpR family regulator